MKLKFWLFQVVGWCCFGLYDTLVNKLSGRILVAPINELTFVQYIKTGEIIKGEIFWSVAFIAVGILLTSIYRWLVIKPFKLADMPIKKLVLYASLSTIIIASILSFLLCVTVVVVKKERPVFELYFFLVFFLTTLLVTLAWNLIYFLYKFMQSIGTLTKDNTQKDLAVKNLELKNIKSKLQPHFIFNALNSIKALVDENPEKARNSVIQLSNILRNSLSSDKDQVVSLEKEIKLVNDYLDLECIRYEERLNVIYDIDKETLQTNIPPLILQNVVENAIKHGIASETNGGFIIITIKNNANNQTIINVENSGTFLPLVNKLDGGFGLESSVKRLAITFGNSANLQITNTANKTVLTTIILPINS
jgi:two-component system, LytTR family, sensor kinase